MEIIVFIIILFMLILYSQINSISLQLSKSDDITTLMIYILLLNFGILYIAFSKKWAFLNWFGFILTAFMQSTAVYKSDLITDIFTKVSF